jgi:hypothetical protein
MFTACSSCGFVFVLPAVLCVHCVLVGCDAAALHGRKSPHSIITRRKISRLLITDVSETAVGHCATFLQISF